MIDKEKFIFDFVGEGMEIFFKFEEFNDFFCVVEEIKNYIKESNSLILLNKDI